MNALAIEVINGLPILVTKGERSEVYVMDPVSIRIGIYRTFYPATYADFLRLRGGAA